LRELLVTSVERADIPFRPRLIILHWSDRQEKEAALKVMKVPAMGAAAATTGTLIQFRSVTQDA
jgi:hypothetical protein